jgi:thiol-disulfide isomerase/thioredoxin
MPQNINRDRRRFLRAAVLSVAAAGLAGCADRLVNRTRPVDPPTIDGNRGVQQMTSAALRLPIEGRLPSLGGATGWLNSEPLAAAGLRGKVVLVDFWTYTCINWIRSLPYVRAWDEKYRDHGLVVLGVHTPEFGFEKDVENVRRAARDFRVGYPVAIDSDYAVWRAFSNHYCPPSTSPTLRGGCGIISSARASTTGRKRSFGSC